MPSNATKRGCDGHAHPCPRLRGAVRHHADRGSLGLRSRPLQWAIHRPALARFLPRRQGSSHRGFPRLQSQTDTPPRCLPARPNLRGGGRRANVRRRHWVNRNRRREADMADTDALPTRRPIGRVGRQRRRARPRLSGSATASRQTSAAGRSGGRTRWRRWRT